MAASFYMAQPKRTSASAIERVKEPAYLDSIIHEMIQITLGCMAIGVCGVVVLHIFSISESLYSMNKTLKLLLRRIITNRRKTNRPKSNRNEKT